MKERLSKLLSEAGELEGKLKAEYLIENGAFVTKYQIGQQVVGISQEEGKPVSFGGNILGITVYKTEDGLEAIYTIVDKDQVRLLSESDIKVFEP